MLEATVEKTVVGVAKMNGFFERKVEWIGRRNAPDRVFSRKDRGTVWIEFKRPNARPTAAQEYEHERMRAAGMEVHFVDSVQAGLEILGIKS